jgi:hypothetical protein
MLKRSWYIKNSRSIAEVKSIVEQPPANFMQLTSWLASIEFMQHDFNLTSDRSIDIFMD